MEFFRSILDWLLYLSLGIAAIRTYLIVNKLWSRRRSKEVAESISLMAVLLTYATTIPFFAEQVVEAQVERAVSDAMKLGSTTVLLFIGGGFFLPSRKGDSPWASFRRALKLEGREAGDLIRAVVSPRHAREVVEILARLALVDDSLDPRERKFVDHLAEEWFVRMDWGALSSGDMTTAALCARLRRSVVRYLHGSPPTQQVLQLRDAVRALVAIDKVVRDEERVMVEEIHALFDRHVDGITHPDYLVVVVTSSDEQERSLRALVPEVARSSVAGGHAFVAGVFSSQAYAQLIRDWYRGLDMLSFVERAEVDPGQALVRGARPV